MTNSSGFNAKMSREITSAALPPEADENTSIFSILAEYRHMTWREVLIGNYDYKHMCMPTICGQERKNRHDD